MGGSCPFVKTPLSFPGAAVSNLAVTFCCGAEIGVYIIEFVGKE